jgi:hypothetical protein
MDSVEVQQRLCLLTTRVAGEVFKWNAAADCWCGENPVSALGYPFSMDESVLRYIEDAVQEKMERELV